MNVIIPPQSSEHTIELLRTGIWTCEETDEGYVIYTTPYSACCNPRPQTKWFLDKRGHILRSEEVPIKGEEK